MPSGKHSGSALRKRTPDPGGGGSQSGIDRSATAGRLKSNLEVTKKTKSSFRTCCIVLLSTFVATVAVLSAYILKVYLHNLAEEQTYFELRLGEEGVNLFKGYDRDGDGFINIAEFEPLVEKLLSEELMNNQVDFSFEDAELDPSEEVLTLEAHFVPLLQESMSKADEVHTTRYLTALAGLNEWTEPRQAFAGFPVGLFKAFLPDEIVPVGQPYHVIKSNLNLFSNTLSSNRFYPPKLKNNKEVTIHRLLSMFHARPFVHTRFGPQGTIAVIRAENEKYVDIGFRIHAEFQLNDPPNHPFWFSPGQFVGNVILTKDSSHIQYFHMSVPNNSSLNVDMEWLYGLSEANNMEVDIGFLPKMELTSSEPSMQVAIYGQRGEVIFEPENKYSTNQREAINWDHAIPLEEVLEAVKVKFYPFQKIPYLPFQEAFSLAETEQKLVHSIVLWGALDDQSC